MKELAGGVKHSGGTAGGDNTWKHLLGEVKLEKAWSHYTSPIPDPPLASCLLFVYILFQHCLLYLSPPLFATDDFLRFGSERVLPSALWSLCLLDHLYTHTFFLSKDSLS